MSKKITVEICAGSVKDCLLAEQYNADRIELNSGLYLGGLTPSLAVFKESKRQVNIPIICMVRPRGAGFCYDEHDVNVMFEDTKIFLENGADGIAFGFLTPDYSIDETLTKQMIDLIHSYGKEAVFHRAFDCVNDQIKATEKLIKLNCNRILTSGKAINVTNGISQLKTLQLLFGKKIEILMGCGVNSLNIEKLLKVTNITQCHTSLKGWTIDPTTSNSTVSYRYGNIDGFDSVDELKIKQFMEIIRGIK